MKIKINVANSTLFNFTQKKCYEILLTLEEFKFNLAFKSKTY